MCRIRIIPRVGNFSIIGAFLAFGLVLIGQGQLARAVEPVPRQLTCVSKTADPTSVEIPANTIVTYTIIVQNTGEQALDNVTITDPLGAGVQLANGLPAGCSSSGDPITVTCDLGTMAVNAQEVVSFDVDLANVTEAQVVNNADVQTSTPNTTIVDGGNCTATINVELAKTLACTDKSASISSLVEGDTTDFFYTITLLAGGVPGAVIENVVLMDDLPNEVSFSSVSVLEGPPLSACTESGGTVTCDFGDITVDAILSNNDRVAKIVVTPDANLTAPDSFVNTATVSADNVTPNPNSCVAPVQVVPGEEPGGCRVTGGGVDETGQWLPSLVEGGESPSINGNTSDRYTFGGQAGANTALQPLPKGEWTHHQQSGPSGQFVFHGGTASAPDGTKINSIECANPPACAPAEANGGFKEITFDGIGTFKNISSDSPLAGNVVPDSQADFTSHWFEVHIEDLGEPGNKPKKNELNACEAASGRDGPDGLCNCPDFYRITIHATQDPGSAVIYEVYGFIDGGNLQIHEPTGFDRQAQQ